MIFTTWTFAIFAVIFLFCYWGLVPQRLKPYVLALGGCVFYVQSMPAYLALIIALGIITYVSSQAMFRIPLKSPRRRLVLFAGILCSVGTLAFFKYSPLFADTVNSLFARTVVPVPHLLVPLAISFFTFEFVHVLIDVYLGKIVTLGLMDFWVFTMFFPTLVAGPIKRFESFAPQVQHIQLPSNANTALGLYRIAIGVAKKLIIADSMTSLTVALTAPNGAPYGRLDYLVAIFTYAIKIYFDFSGYSDIAIGLGELLGVRIPENFDRPYRARNIALFWRKWHMSLSSWIRDYIFIPLGGSRRPPFIVCGNLLLAMGIAGIWHGAAWTFLAWGLWHGFGLAMHRGWGIIVVPHIGFLQRPSLTIALLSTMVTFAFVCSGWILFAATSFENAQRVFMSAFLP